MKYVFFGTPKFASIILEKLIKSGYIPKAAVCNPDEPIGRKSFLTPPPVKRQIFDLKLKIKDKIKIFQPEKLKGNKKFSEEFKKIKAELAIVAAYGKIIPKEILDIPPLGFINVHPSLLPKYRGASPIQYSILSGDKQTGVTIMNLDEEMDHGPILAKSEIPISKSETYESLSKKLAELGAEILIKIIPDYISGKIKPTPQDHSKATYTKIIKKEDGKIDWSKNAEKIERMTRAYYPWPSAWTVWNGKILKILEAEILENKNNYKIGEIFLTDKKELAVKCGNGNLIIKKLQLEGGKILPAKDFLNGHRDFIGSVLK